MQLNSTYSPHPKYRSDIDGLRAIAVLAVVVYHAFPKFFQGGFIGVDIFFVISGYLITTIIFKGLESGEFGFLGFYARRVRRIFPALIVVLTACIFIGWVALLGDEYKQLGKHITAGATFTSNFILLNEAGYFDNLADTKPLLHLWSLGIEEQFYILWPILLWLSWRLKFNLLLITLFFAVASFAFSLYEIKGDVVSAFYTPHSRFWELLSGSLLAWVILHKNKINTLIQRNFQMSGWDFQTAFCNALSILGFLLLTLGFWRINKDLSFPGKWALIPVIATVLLIAAGGQALINRTLLSNKIVVWFGLISFPLYLWHWPLLSFLRIISSEEPSLSSRLLVICLSILLSYITYFFVEKPFRFGGNTITRLFILFFCLGSMGLIGLSIFSNNGYLARDVVKINPSVKTGEDGGIPSNILINECGIEDKSLKEKFANCVSDRRSPPRYALLGDSKAAALFPGLMRTSNEVGRWLFIGGNGPNGAPIPLISESELYKKTMPMSKAAIKSIAENKNIEKVVFVMATRNLFDLPSDVSIEQLPFTKNYEIALNGLKESVKFFERHKKKVVLVVDNPTLPHPEDCLNRKTTITILNQYIGNNFPEDCVISLVKHRELSAKYMDLLRETQRNYPNTVTIFDTAQYLCNLESLVCEHKKNKRFLYGYTDHISDYASGLIGADLNLYLESH